MAPHCTAGQYRQPPLTTTPWPKAIIFALISPLIIVNLLINPSTLRLRCYSACQRKHETSNEHAACEANTTCMFIPLFFEFILNSRNRHSGFFREAYVESLRLLFIACLVISLLSRDILL